MVSYKSLNQSIRRAFGFMHGNFLVITSTQMLKRFFGSMITPYASLYILALGGKSAQLGLSNSLLPLAGLLVFPLAGYFTDMAGRVKLITFAGYLTGVTLLIYIFAPSWEWVVFATFIHGFMVFQFPPTSAILADSLTPKNRGTGMATISTLVSAVGMFSPIIAGMVLQNFDIVLGMRILYALLAMAFIIGAYINSRYLEETASDASSQHPPKKILSIFKEVYSGIPSMLRQLPSITRSLGAIIILCFVANAIISPFWVVYAVECIGLSPVEWGAILSVEAILRTLLSIPAGMLVDRYGRANSIRVALTLSLASIPIFVFSTTFFEVLLIRSTVAVANVLLTPACSALIADTVPRNIRGRVIAAFGRGEIRMGAAGGGAGGPGMGFFITIPIIIAYLSGGILYSVNPTYPWYFFLATVIICLILSVMFIRDPPKAEI